MHLLHVSISHNIMRIFLAPYRFRIKNGKISDILAGLEKLKNTGNKDEMQKLFLKIESFTQQKNTISGILEHGHYGDDKNIIDTDTIQITKKIKINESALEKFYFVFDFIDLDKGLLILQRRGNIGVRSLFLQSLKDQLKYRQIEITIEPVVIGIKELLERPLKKIVIKVPTIPKQIDERLGNIKVKNVEGVEFEFIIYAKRNQEILSQIIETLKEQVKNNQKLNIGTVFDPNETISIQVNDGKNQRTIIVNQSKFRSWIECTDEKSVIDQALEFIKDIRESYEFQQVMRGD